MPREKIVVPGEGHTLACLIRTALFDNDATFAACVVPHPQDDSLTVEIEASNPKECLLLALRDARAEVEQYLATTKSKLIQDEMVDQ